MLLTVCVAIYVLISVFVYIMMDTEETSIIQERLRAFTSTSQDEVLNKQNSIKTFFIEVFKPVLASTMDKKNKKTIKNLMAEAGLSNNDDDLLKFAARRFMYSGFGFLIGLAFVMLFGINLQSLIIITALPIGLYILPIFAFRGIAKNRTKEISRNLPDALDLLTICVEAGLGLDAAMNRVAKEFQMNSSVLAGEFERVSKDVMAGISRQEAFRNLSARNNVPELKSLAALLIQADKLGTSVSKALRVYSDTIRTKRKQKVEELAQKASIKMTIPLVFFVLPAMFVVILAPAAITMMENMK